MKHVSLLALLALLLVTSGGVAYADPVIGTVTALSASLEPRNGSLTVQGEVVCLSAGTDTLQIDATQAVGQATTQQPVSARAKVEISCRAEGEVVPFVVTLAASSRGQLQRFHAGPLSVTVTSTEAEGELAPLYQTVLKVRH
ncbi:MAG: hypothetical protein M3281_01830 [Chloroflexota bacterium]|nr:hypothetical protein [Chloroflexota bacterium]